MLPRQQYDEDDEQPLPWQAEFKDEVGQIHISGRDFDKMCFETDGWGSAAAYIHNFAPPADSDDMIGWVHYCDVAFETQFYHMELPQGEQVGPFHRNAFCDVFRTADGAYRYHSRMDSLGAAFVHEMTHFNPIGRAARPSFRLRVPPDHVFITDFTKGPYMAYDCMSLGGGLRCLYNAPSYQWLVNEVSWSRSGWGWRRRELLADLSE